MAPESVMMMSQKWRFICLGNPVPDLLAVPPPHTPCIQPVPIPALSKCGDLVPEHQTAIATYTVTGVAEPKEAKRAGVRRADQGAK